VFISRRMKMRLYLSCLLLVFAGLAICAEEATPKPAEEARGNAYVEVFCNYFADIGEKFEVYVSLHPYSESKKAIRMDQTWGAAYTPSTFVLVPGGKQSISAIIKKSTSGISWIHATSPGYDDGWCAVVVDFEGRLKPSANPTLSYETANSLTVSPTDKAGKPLRLPAQMMLGLTSTDGLLSLNNSTWVHEINLELPPGSQTSHPFQIRSTLIQGGNIGVVATLTLAGQPQVLAQDEFVLNADPAWWLPVLLAVMGGLLHGTYKVVRLEDDIPRTKRLSSVGIMVGSALAGLIGYFFAHLDLLGFKLARIYT
jgi:hypothetical protein